MTYSNSNKPNNELYKTEFINGTGSKNDYMVIGTSKDGNAIIAVKPLIGSENGKFSLSCRLRAVLNPDGNIDIASMDVLENAFPNIPWKAKSPARLSVIIPAETTVTPELPVSAINFVKGKWLTDLKKLCEGYVSTTDDAKLVSYMTDSALRHAYEILLLDPYIPSYDPNFKEVLQNKTADLIMLEDKKIPDNVEHIKPPKAVEDSSKFKQEDTEAEKDPGDKVPSDDSKS